MTTRAYLDWASTAPVDPEIQEEYSQVIRNIYGNPSSLHSEGKKAAKLLEEARSSLASCLGVNSEKLIFTSGGSESNSLVLLSLLRKKRRGRVLISSIEHPAVWEYTGLLREFGFNVKTIPSDSGGFITPDAVASLLTEDTMLVTVMTVNNETGAIQPIQEIGRLIRNFEKQANTDIHFHTDAVQAFGKIELPLAEMAVDSAAFSSHKVSGPKGVGLLYLDSPLQPLLLGGGQEGGYRPGTENVASAYAFSLAASRRCESLLENHRAASSLKKKLLNRLEKLEGVRPLFGGESGENYSPYITGFSVAPLPGEVLLRVLNDRGFALSTGSACSSNARKKRGRVLTSMGFSEQEALGMLRVSVGWSTEEEEIDALCSTLEKELPTLLKTVR